MKRSVPYLRPVGVSGIPRADQEIRRTIETLRCAQFEQDPLFDAGDSFRLSLCNSAVKREGAIIEAAIKDAIEQTSHLRLIGRDKRIPRQIDIQFEMRDNGWIIACEIKRGSMHDSTKLRQFRADLKDIPPLLETSLTLFPAENIKFHNVLTARQRYSTAIKAVLRERGL